MMECDIILPPFTRFIRSYYAHTYRKELLNHIVQMTSIFNEHREQFKMTNYDYKFKQETNPFFQTPTSQSTDDNDVYKNTDGYSEIDSLLASYKGCKPIVFNPYFMMLYISVNKTNRAFTYGVWTIFSLQQIIYDFNTVCTEEPDIKWLTLGHAYMGLGYYNALRMDITNGRLFIQTDGGSNNYDRIAYWDTYKNQQLIESDYLTFEQVIEYFKKYE